MSVKLRPLAPRIIMVAGGLKIMKRKQNLSWLEKKIETLRSFDGSLIGYVSSSPSVQQISAKCRVSPSEVLKLDANENFFVDSNFLNEVFLEILKDVDLRLYDPKAMAELGKALGVYVGVSPECLLVGSGSEQLVDFIVKFFLKKGDNSVSIEPSFFMYGKRVWLSGARLISVPLKKDLSLDVEGVLEKVTEKTKLIFVCSPNNPTGNQFSWDEIAALADESSAVVVVDEAYSEFGDFSVCPLAVDRKNVVVVRTFSKAFGLAGLRFGYAVAHRDLASVFSEIIPYTVSTVTARYVQRLLGKIAVVEGWNARVKKERKKLIEGLRRVNGMDVLDSKTNFVTFKPHKDAEGVYNRLLERGIIVKNLGDLPLIGHCLRVTVGLPDMNDRFLKAMSEIVQ
jgi:histidinol-phosphate aminotransferase